MSPKCEDAVKIYLPLFRSLIAEELIQKYKLTQVQTAEKLGTTQAAISQYLSSKRAKRRGKELGERLGILEECATETAKQIMDGQLSPENITVDFCKICPAICEEKS